MSDRYWIIPVLVKAQPEELDKIRSLITSKLGAYYHRHDLAREINPEWLKAENSPIKSITEADYALIKVGPEPKEPS